MSDVEKTLASLRAMSARDLAAHVDDSGDRLVQEARAAGKDGVKLLRFLIENEASRAFTLDFGLRAWLEIDAAEAVLVAVEHIDAIDRATFVAALATMDGAEAVDFLHARLATDPDVLAFVAHADKLVSGQDRFVDIALGRVHDDVTAAVTMLGNIGTPRALEEMNAIIEKNPAQQERLRIELLRVRARAERERLEREHSAELFATAQQYARDGNVDIARALARTALTGDPDNDVIRAFIAELDQRR